MAIFGQSIAIVGDLVVTGTAFIDFLPAARFILTGPVPVPDSFIPMVVIWDAEDYNRGEFVNTEGAITVPNPGLYCVVLTLSITPGVGAGQIGTTVDNFGPARGTSKETVGMVTEVLNYKAQFNVVSIASPITTRVSQKTSSVGVLNSASIVLWRVGDSI